MKTIVVILFLLFATPAYAGNWTIGIDGGAAIPTQNYFPAYVGDQNSIDYKTGQDINYQNPLEASTGYMISGYVLHSLWKYIDAGFLYSYDSTASGAPEPFFPANYQSPHGTFHFPGAVKIPLGNAVTNAGFLYTRIHPWIFGSWEPFFGAGIGFSFNQWLTPVGTVDRTNFHAHVADAVATRLELGTDYKISEHFNLEALMGGMINDPSVQIWWPDNGTDQRMNMILFFVQVGVNFKL